MTYECEDCGNDVEQAIKEFFDDANAGMIRMGRTHQFPILCACCLEEKYNIADEEVLH